MSCTRHPTDPSAPARPTAPGYAARLLSTLPGNAATIAPAPARMEPHPALEWARSGAMALCGELQAAPRLAPGPLATCCRGAAQALNALSPEHATDDLDAPALLGERAAIAGLRRRGSTAPGGRCRFVRCSDDWLAVNMARDEDESLLPAWLAAGDFRTDPGIDLWDRIAEAARRCSAESLLSRARLLGLPVAGTAESRSSRDRSQAIWCRTTRVGTQAVRRPGTAPLVVDLSSLWAGPLCTQLLGTRGARIIKVESRSRPDGARSGPPAFFDLMNAGKQCVGLDLHDLEDRVALHRLIASADIVVESSRPRALRQLGIDAEASLERTAGQVWLSITGYGREEPQANWVAFGDDAAVAAGLLLLGDGEGAPPAFCADAVADPLTGLHAAVAALAAWRAGGGAMLDVPLRDVAAYTMAFGGPPSPAVVRATSRETTRRHPAGPPDAEEWEVRANGDRQAVMPPRARTAPGRARALGADTREVLREFAPAC